MSLQVKSLLESPDYFPLKFDGSGLLFVRMSRDSYSQSIFTLPDRIITAGSESWSIPFADIVDLVENAEQPETSPVCIFQIAHCGSTLLSRALDQAGSSLVIREPFTLRQLAAAPMPANPTATANRHRAISAIWHLLSRQYKSSEPVLLKTNVPVNYALAEILQQSPVSNGLLLYSKFEDYMAAALKSDQRRAWAKHVVRELAPRIQGLPGFSSLHFETLSEAQAIAILWFSQICCYAQALQQNSNLRSLLSDDLYANPAATLQASANHLAIQLSGGDIERITNGELFSRHAKQPQMAYSNTKRLAELKTLQQQFKAEIDQTLDWSNRCNFSVSTDLLKSKAL